MRFWRVRITFDPGRARIRFWGTRSGLAASAAALAVGACFAASASGSGQPPQCSEPSADVEHGDEWIVYPSCWDPEGDSLTVTVTQQPQHGTLTGPSASNELRYRPDGSYTGADQFVYTATDGTSDPVEVTARATVVATRDDAPSCSSWAASGNVEAGEDHSVSVSCWDDEGVEVAVRVMDQPDHGTISGPDQYGYWTYRPEGGFTGQDSITFVGSDGGQDSSPTTTTVEVVPAVNDPPQCDSVARFPLLPPGWEHEPLEGGEKATWHAYCSDDERATLTARVTDPPEHGTAEPDGTSVIYTAGNDHTGTDGFKFMVSDGVHDSQEHSVTFEVRPLTDDPPECGGFGGTIEQDESLSVQPICYDDEGYPLSYEVVDGPEHGTVAPGQWSSLMYTPEADFLGTDGMTVRASDGTQSTDVTGEVTVIAAQNDPPYCTLSSGGGFGGGGSTLESGDTLEYSLMCWDDEGADVAVDVTKDPQHGTLAITGRSIRYTADASYTGSDSFTVRGDDGSATSQESTATLNVVAAKDDPPTCSGSVRGGFFPFSPVEAGETGPVTITCSDDEGADVESSVTDDPAHGELIPDGIGGLVYEPEPGFTGNDEFKVNGRTPAGQESAQTKVPIYVAPATNQAPLCFVGWQFRAESGEKEWLDAACFDDEGDQVSFEVVQQPDHGRIELLRGRPPVYPYTSTVRLSYTPDAGYTGPDRFKLRAGDGTNTPSEYPFSVAVGAANDDPPDCYGPGFGTRPGEPVTLDFATACFDDEGGPLDFEIVDQPTHGSLTGPDSEGRFTYTPERGYEGPDSLTFRASDGTHSTATITASLYQSAPGTGCQFNRPQLWVPAGGSITIDSKELCAGDTDHNVRPWITPPAHGSLVANADGTVTYTAQPGYSGTDSLGLRVDDGERSLGEALLVLVVGGPPNAAPTCDDTSIHVLRDTVTPIPLACDDADGDALSIARVSGSGPSHGRLGQIDSNAGQVMYRPAAGFLGEDLFRFIADDGRAGGFSAPAAARIVVAAEGTARDVQAGESVSTGGSASASDPLTATVTSPAAGHVAVFEGPPANDAPGGYSFLGQEVSIQAPRGTTENPLQLFFEVAASLLPPGSDPASVVVFRNGVLVAACSGEAGHASPTPCVAGREELSNGNLRIRIFTVEASRWNFGTATGGGAGNGNGTDPGDQNAAGDTRPPPPRGDPPQPPPDSAAPSVTLAVKKGQRLSTVLRSGLRVEARCSTACSGSVTVTLDAKLAKKLRIAAKLGTAKVRLTSAGRVVVVLKIGKKARVALARTKRAPRPVSARAADPAGNAAAAKPVKLTIAR